MKGPFKITEGSSVEYFSLDFTGIETMEEVVDAMNKAFKEVAGMKWYRCWNKSTREYLGDVKCFEVDLSHQYRIYEEISPPECPKPSIKELKDGLYYCLDGDGNPVVMSRSKGQWFDADGYTREHDNIKSVIGLIPVEPIG